MRRTMEGLGYGIRMPCLYMVKVYGCEDRERGSGIKMSAPRQTSNLSRDRCLGSRHLFLQRCVLHGS